MNQQITVELPDAVLAALLKEADRRGVSVEEVAAELLRTLTEAEHRTVMDVMDEVLDEFSELHQRLA